jgi:hypothetical protein
MKVVGGPTGINAEHYGGRSWYGGWWGGRSSGMMSQNVSVDSGAGSGGQGTVALGRISVTAGVSMQFKIQ